jgi:hypothetical protein
VASRSLIDPTWREHLDLHELRILLHQRIGGPGQIEGADSAKTLLIPEAGPKCQVKLLFNERGLRDVEKGPAFDHWRWSAISDEISGGLLKGTPKFGRDISFVTARVGGYWTGERSKIQILPMPPGAVDTTVVTADHPFILEFPLRDRGCSEVTNYCRRRDHRQLTLLLNLLLPWNVTTYSSARKEPLWVTVPREGKILPEWLSPGYIADIGHLLLETPSSTASNRLGMYDREEDVRFSGRDDLIIRSDLDELLCTYKSLPKDSKEILDRSLYWFWQSRRQWSISTSTSVVALVSSIESMLKSEKTHTNYCDICNEEIAHQAPSVGKLFREYLENYATGESNRAARGKMYELRSSIVHGDRIMLIDEEKEFGWDYPSYYQYNVITELWGVARTSLINWLKSQSSTPKPA